MAKGSDRGAFVRANWPWLTAVGVGFLAWGHFGGNALAAVAGLAWLGWIGWHTLVRRE